MSFDAACFEPKTEDMSMGDEAAPMESRIWPFLLNLPMNP